MIITIHGTDRSHNSAPVAIVTYTAFTMMQTKNTRNIILPLVDSDNIRDIENIAYGKTDIHEIMQGEGVYSDSGIDALITRAETDNLNVQTFGTYITQTYGKKHRLDIAGMTRQIDFESDIAEKLDSIDKLLKRAQKAYDNVYVLLNGFNASLCAKIDDMADKTIIMISQGDADKDLDIKRVKEGKAILVSKDYEAESRWTAEAMQRDYGVKKIYVMPHNVKYRDATIAGRIIEFAEYNAEVDKSDDNYQFTKAITDTIQVLFGKIKEDEEEDEELPRKEKIEKEPLKEKRELDESMVELEEIEEKKWFFFKKKYKRVTLSEDAKKQDEEQKHAEFMNEIDKNADFSDIEDEVAETQESTETMPEETKEEKIDETVEEIASAEDIEEEIYIEEDEAIKEEEPEETEALETETISEDETDDKNNEPSVEDIFDEISGDETKEEEVIEEAKDDLPLSGEPEEIEEAPPKKGFFLFGNKKKKAEEKARKKEEIKEKKRKELEEKKKKAEETIEEEKDEDILLNETAETDGAADDEIEVVPEQDIEIEKPVEAVHEEVITEQTKKPLTAAEKMKRARMQSQ